MSEMLLDVEGLTKRYRKLVAVDALDLCVERGDFIGLIGPNGAGKSTTMGCVTGMLNPDRGAIRLGEVDVIDEPLAARRLISFVPQHPELHGWLTGEEYLRFVGEVRGAADEALDEQVEELLALAELLDARHRLVKEYSGGMMRKLAIGAALVGAPELLLLDESFVGLDPESTYRIRRRLIRFCDDGGAIVLSSHILEMLERICTRIVMLVDGRKVVDAPMDELREEFEDPDGPDDLVELYLERSGKEIEGPDD
jgi:ABC-2 type transport system ATP-binding protein